MAHCAYYYGRMRRIVGPLSGGLQVSRGGALLVVREREEPLVWEDDEEACWCQ